MDISFTWVGGATWILEIAGLKIACDPVLCPAGSEQDYFWFKTRRLNDPVYDAGDFDTIDLWLITHGHEDHLDPQGCSVIREQAHVITHRNAVSKLKTSLAEHLTVLDWGDSEAFSVKGFEIVVEAVPAVHGINPVSALFAGGVNGYWLTVTGNGERVSIYATSDTVTHRTVLRALQGRKVDLLIPNMGAAKKGSWMGTLTLSATMLQQIRSILRPRITIPVHFETFSHYVEPISEVAKEEDTTTVLLEPGRAFHGTL